jgi:enterochelin esterase-like enzyme
MILALAGILAPAVAGWAVPALAGDLSFELRTGVPGQHVFLAGNLTDWDATRLAIPESSPGIYSLTIPAPWLPELDYKFVVDGQWIGDSSNPWQQPDGYGSFNSVRATGFVEDPLLELRPGAHPLESRAITLADWTGAQRTITLLAPAGTPSGVVYFQDGGDYLEKTGVANLFANLADEGIVLAGVFVPPRDRENEYELNDSYADWLAGPVVAAAERALGAAPAAGRRLVMGASLGGLISVHTALRHPEVFPLVASESGSLFWADETIPRKLATKVPVSLYLDCGSFEAPTLVGANRHARDGALAAGNRLFYSEYPSTHDWIAWRNRLQTVLRHFFQARR